MIDLELSSIVRAELETHAASCEDCQKAQAERLFLKRLVQRHAEKPELSDAARARFKSTLGTQRSATSVWRYAAAAVLVIAGSLGVAFIFDGETKLGHAETSRAVYTTFQDVLDRAPQTAPAPPLPAWQDQLRNAFYAATGSEIGTLPTVENVECVGCEPQDVGGVPGYRVDLASTRKRGALICIFLLPAKAIEVGMLTPDSQVAHSCVECLQLETGSVLCFYRQETLVTVTSNLEPQELALHVRH